MSTATILAGLLIGGLADPGSVGDDAPWEPVALEGRAVLLVEALKALDLPADTELVGKQVVVLDDAGAIAPLLADEASNALFLDERLRGRRIEVNGRVLPGNPYVQVISFRVEENGRLNVVQYHCEVCAIDVRYPQICPCCQGSMELQMSPEGR